MYSSIYMYNTVGSCTSCYIIYINKTGDEPQKQETEANKRTPHLREEVPYQITLIRLRQWQGSLDRGRREKVIRKMFPEDDNTYYLTN